MNYKKYINQIKLLESISVTMPLIILPIILLIFCIIIKYYTKSIIVDIFMIINIGFMLSAVIGLLPHSIAYKGIEYKILYNLLLGNKQPLFKVIDYNSNIDREISSNDINIFKRKKITNILCVNSHNNEDLVGESVKNFNNSIFLKNAVCYVISDKTSSYKVVVVSNTIFNILTKLKITTNVHNVMLSTYSDEFDKKIINEFSDKSYDKTEAYSYSNIVFDISNISNAELAKLKICL
ncbi:MAG: hypothetical protein [Caudoviricetes sp.]|nr:MAG: hypothetical protein [Caudoviricetes sp.]